MVDHAAVMDAVQFWRQFVVPFYFDRRGDEVEGTLISYRAEGPRDDAVPQIRLQTPDGRVFEVTAHQERLKAALVRAAPARGDNVRIAYTGDAERAMPGMTPAKLFTVEVTRSGAHVEASDGRGKRDVPPTSRPPAPEEALRAAQEALADKRRSTDAGVLARVDANAARLRLPLDPFEMNLGQIARYEIELVREVAKGKGPKPVATPGSG